MPDIPLYFDLTKAKNLSKLVAKQVQVSRGGKTFMMTVWVDPNTGKSVQSDAKIDFKDFEALKGDRDKAMKFLKDNGVVWDEHPNPAINWMRASMAAKAAGGVASTAAPKYSTGKSSTAGSSASTATGGTKAAPKVDYTKAAAKGYDSADKKKKTAILKAGMTKDEFIAMAGAVTSWTANPNEGINMMRASMAFSAWAESHSLADLETALTGATTQTPAQAPVQPTPPPAPPKPKEELEITAAHTPRQQALIKIINGITDKKDLEDFASVGMIPMDDTAKSFILGKLQTEYNKHIKPRLTGSGGYGGSYYGQRELQVDFARRTSKLFKGMHQKIIKDSIGNITNVANLYDLVTPRDGISWNGDAHSGHGQNTDVRKLTSVLNLQFGRYMGTLHPDDDPDKTDYTTQNRLWAAQLVDKIGKEQEYTTDYSKLFDPDKEGFILALRHIGESDPKLKDTAESMEADYLEMQKLVGYSPSMFRTIQSVSYAQIKDVQQQEAQRNLKANTIIDYLRKTKGMSDADIIATIDYNADHRSKADGFVLCKEDDNGIRTPLRDSAGERITVDLSIYPYPDGTMMWKPTDVIISTWSDYGTNITSYNLNAMVRGDDRYAAKRAAFDAITPGVYDKFYEIQQRMYGYKLQDTNSMQPFTGTLSDLDQHSFWGVEAIRDGDDPERDAVLSNLSFMANASAFNTTLAQRVGQNPNSTANKQGTDYSGNFSYYNFQTGPQAYMGYASKRHTPDEAQEVCRQQLENLDIFSMDELQTLSTYVSNNGDPSMKSFGKGQAVDEMLSRIHSLSPERQGWSGIKGSPIDDVYVKYLEATLQYCPQVYNQRVTDKTKMRAWLHKQLGFTPYEPPKVDPSTTVPSTDLYQLRQALFSKAHCSVRTATQSEYDDVTHQVKLNFDHVDPTTGQRVDKSRRSYDDRSIALHGKVYVIENSEAEENFEQEAARMGETPVQMFHGTSYAGGCGIVGIDGRFRISGKETSGLQTTGSMLGEGIYMAKLVGKTLPYLGNHKYSFSNYKIQTQPGPTQGFAADGCLLVCDALLGKHYHSDIDVHDAKRHNDGTYDSVAVGAGAAMGGSRLKEYECIVRRNNQIKPKYIVDCGGRNRR
ncbi:MAG: hypothetical protein NC548_20110 [Lachnospiraceae bacterium]|nr:hypothetical protein [Lachnospiraceae bacterium]